MYFQDLDCWSAFQGREMGTSQFRKFEAELEVSVSEDAR
jgi:hypothetical protein